jgi:hypothetical protein
MCFVTASETKQSVGLVQLNLNTSARKLTDWFNETPIRFTLNDTMSFCRSQ